MAPPHVPPELVADIIELTVERLAKEERHLEAHAPLLNRFLVSAALVNRTWHAIATPSLLKNATVTSGSVVGFLAQVKEHKMEATLKSVRFGEASGGVAAEDAAKEDTAFDLLIGSLSELEVVELIESGHHFQTALPPGRTIGTVLLLNYRANMHGVGRKFKQCPPTHLIVTETRPGVAIESPEDTSHNDMVTILARSEHLTIVTAVHSVLYFFMLQAIGGREAPSRSRLRSCHFEGTSLATGSADIIIAAIPYSLSFNTMYCYYPHLEHVTTHLGIAWYLLPGNQLKLKSLEILPNARGPFTRLEYEYEEQIIDLVYELPALEKLRVPACWASDAVREGCEAKGITLLSG